MIVHRGKCGHVDRLARALVHIRSFTFKITDLVMLSASLGDRCSFRIAVGEWCRAGPPTRLEPATPWWRSPWFDIALNRLSQAPQLQAEFCRVQKTETLRSACFGQRTLHVTLAIRCEAWTLVLQHSWVCSSLLLTNLLSQLLRSQLDLD